MVRYSLCARYATYLILRLTLRVRRLQRCSNANVHIEEESVYGTEQEGRKRSLLFLGIFVVELAVAEVILVRGAFGIGCMDISDGRMFLSTGFRALSIDRSLHIANWHSVMLESDTCGFQI